MLFRLLTLFIAVPLVELALLFWIARHLGGWETFSLVLVTGFVGATLARAEGLKTMQQIQRDMAEGRMPGDMLLQGAMILVAGALLVTPGVITDAVGLMLLVPMTRHAVARWSMTWLRRHVTVTAATPPPGASSDTPRRYVASRVSRVESEED